jgi:hypothetical protein
VRCQELQRDLAAVVDITRDQYPNGMNRSEEEMNNAWNGLIEGVYSCSLDCLGTLGKRSRDWFDENDVAILNLLREKNRAHDSHLANPSSVALKRIWQVKRAEVQTILREMQNRWWIERAREIQTFADENKIHEFYEFVRSVCGPVRNAPAPLRSADGHTLLKNKHEILDSQSCGSHGLDELPVLPEIPEKDEPPALVEAISRLKNGKSPGPDGVPAEVFKYGGHELTSHMHEFIVACWNDEKIPSRWRSSNIVTIYKRKGDRAVCGNSRGISLLDVASKIFGRVLLDRLVGYVADRMLPESQCGFRADRSTHDMIFVCRQLFEKCREQHQPISVAFIDLRKAFDTVNRELMFEVLARFGCPPKFVSLIRQLYQNTTARVAAGGDMSESFPVEVGVKQGCVLAPVLFNDFLVAVTLLARVGRGEEEADGISLRYRLDGGISNLCQLKARTKTREVVVRYMQCADDAGAVSHTAEPLQDLITDLGTAYRRLGLQINAG